jgi:hypothetical protein
MAISSPAEPRRPRCGCWVAGELKGRAGGVWAETPLQALEATRTVVGADGTGLTLAHEDGRPRWVAVSDGFGGTRQTANCFAPTVAPLA